MARRPSRVSCLVLLLAVCALLVVGAGCGEGGGVAEGAAVTAYVAAPLCGEAKRELERARAGEVSVRIVCLAEIESSDGLSLATIGANARRASEDSTTVGYLELPGSATRFSRPILEEAGIASISSSSGEAAMARLLHAVNAADGSGSLREEVAASLGA